jgi:ABC-type uncharacterized transport system substrate-binding protein
MRRRDLIKGIAGSTAAWPFAAVAQQPAIPVIGFLSFRSANESANSEAAFREGLSEVGYSDGRNVHIAFRWAEGQKDRLPVLASDLVDNLRVAVIAATGGGPSALAAKAATKTIPVVFTFNGDPVVACRRGSGQPKRMEAAIARDQRRSRYRAGIQGRGGCAS